MVGSHSVLMAMNLPAFGFLYWLIGSFISKLNDKLSLAAKSKPNTIQRIEETKVYAIVVAITFIWVDA